MASHEEAQSSQAGSQEGRMNARIAIANLRTHPWQIFDESGAPSSEESTLDLAKIPFKAWRLLHEYLLSSPKSLSAAFATTNAAARCAHDPAWVVLLEIEGARRGRALSGSTAAQATATHIIARERKTPALTYALERLNKLFCRT